MVESWVVVLLGIEMLVVQDLMRVLVVAKNYKSCPGNLEPLLVEVEVEVEGA